MKKNEIVTYQCKSCKKRCISVITFTQLDTIEPPQYCLYNTLGFQYHEGTNWKKKRPIVL